MKFPILISYAYARKNEEAFAQYVNSPHIEVLLDCGAFTARNSGHEIKLEDYCLFLDKWKDKLFRYLALDKVGDPVQTEINLREMIRNGYKPMPVHIRGDDERRMDELYELSDYVALAGVRRPKIGHAPKSYIKAKLKWAKGRKTHLLGYVREDMFDAYRPTSCDSASWGCAKMWGICEVYLGRGNWVYAVKYKQHMKLVRSPEAMELISRFGWTEQDVRNESLWRRNKEKGVGEKEIFTEVITADSWVRYVIDVYKRWGLKVFIATSLAGDLYSLKGAIDKHVDLLHLGHNKV